MPTSTLFATRLMALFNPVYALVIPSLFIITVPLAILAGITTTLAFSVLILRVIVVYLDIALSLLPQSLASLNHRPPTVNASSSSSSSLSSLKQQLQQQQHQSSTPIPIRTSRRRRPSSATSAISGGSATSIVSAVGGLGLMPSIGPERDFEGVGGWRIGGDALDDEVWTTVNPKLEMPDRPFSFGSSYHHHHHHRTPSGATNGPTTPGEGGYLMMRTTRNRSPEVRSAANGASIAAARAPSSPNSSRARTPTGPRLAFAPVTVNPNADSYFAITAGSSSPKTPKRQSGHGFD